MVWAAECRAKALEEILKAKQAAEMVDWGTVSQWLTAIVAGGALLTAGWAHYR